MASITIQATDGSGGFSAYSVEPKSKPAGAVVLIQEIFGVNQAMRDTADWVADLGFLASARTCSGGSSRASTSPTSPRPSGRRRSSCSASSTRRRASRI